MPLIKCPRCELNYMPDTERYCTVCKREMRGDDDKEDVEICTECGEHPVVPGEDLCAYCLKEITRQERAIIQEDDEPVATEAVAGLDAASGMNEIDIEIDRDIPSAEFNEINRELDLNDDDEESDKADEEEEAPAAADDDDVEMLDGLMNGDDDLPDDEEDEDE